MSKATKRATALDLSHDALEKFRAIIREENAEMLHGMLPKCQVNYFRQVERMLEIYKPLKAILADEAAYKEIEYHERSKDIVSFSPSAGQSVPMDERIEEMERARDLEYRNSKEKLERIERVIRQFSEHREFIAIRMYYFNEDAAGNERGADAPRYTWDDVAYALGKDTKTVRRWKNNMINKMAACIGGLEAIKAEAVHWAKGLDN
ncbi:MAG: hypothetical protein EOM66_02695 [Clostridia bacterium]|nr:hypothetical protein [Clostridia bacterium]